MNNRLTIVMIGATGAVGSSVIHSLLAHATDSKKLEKLSLLGRRPLETVTNELVEQHKIDVMEPGSYASLLAGHNTAICTLGVGEPSKVTKEQWLRIDKTAVLDFARECKKARVAHFQVLTSIGSDSKSRSYFLRGKGELEDELVALNFERLSIFQPSMIITPTNRYGLSQAITLAVWPVLSKLMIAGLAKFRGVKVATLGTAIANSALIDSNGVSRFSWADFQRLSKRIQSEGTS